MAKLNFETALSEIGDDDTKNISSSCYNKTQQQPKKLLNWGTKCAP